MPAFLPDVLILVLKVVGGFFAVIAFICLLAAAALYVCIKRSPPEDWNR